MPSVELPPKSPDPLAEIRPRSKPPWPLIRAKIRHYLQKLDEGRARRQAEGRAKSPAPSTAPRAQSATQRRERELAPSAVETQNKLFGPMTEPPAPSESARGSTDKSREIVRDPVTGKLVYKSLLEASEKAHEAIMSPDRVKRRVF
jgi:hypothetical protein